ncbi:NAD(P)-binding protein [Mycena polygramma]|nr:NAD(P)-binding protein [Mycena polygramma]
MPTKLLLVTGATGKQGRALIQALNLGCTPDSEPEFHVLALTRTISSPAANALAAHNSQHITVTIRKIFEDAKRKHGGIWGVFCVLAFPGLGADAAGEENQGKTLADIAAEHGVSSYIFSSVERGGEYNDDNAKLDRLAKAVEDIGHVSAAVFKNPQNYVAQILVLVGEVSTLAQQEESYRRATGKHLPTIPDFLARTLIALNSHTKALIADMERVHEARTTGKCPEVAEQNAAAKRAYPEMKSFEAWARQRAGKHPEESKGWNKVSVAGLATGKQ